MRKTVVENPVLGLPVKLISLFLYVKIIAVRLG